MAGRMFTGWKLLFRAGLLAGLLALTLPAVVRSEVLEFRNDTKAVVVVQGACVVDGKVKRDQPIQVQPGGSARIVLPGNKQITIFDGKPPNLPLFQGNLPASLENQMYSITPDATGQKVRVDRVKVP
jgi:redox-sensitive bicupin YhaK (pirin superfamily)